VSEWELREREEKRRAGAEELGAGGEEQSLFLPTPSFMASVDRIKGRVTFSFVISLVRIIFPWVKRGWRANGSLQCAAIARTADGNWSKYKLSLSI